MDLYEYLHNESYFVSDTRVLYIPNQEMVRVIIVQESFTVALEIILNEAKTYFYIDTIVVARSNWLNKPLQFLFETFMRIYTICTRKTF